VPARGPRRDLPLCTIPIRHDDGMPDEASRLVDFDVHCGFPDLIQLTDSMV
jgi:hypothetical protein